MSYYVFGMCKSFDTSSQLMDFQKVGECVSDEVDSSLFIQMMQFLQTVDGDYTSVLFRFDNVGDIIEAEINAELRSEQLMVNIPPDTILRIKRIGNSVTFFPSKEWLPTFKEILKESNLQRDFIPHNGDFEW